MLDTTPTPTLDRTPFIDSLATTEGLIIEKFYALPACTMTRSAFLTGRHPMRFGLHEGVISYESNYGLTRKEFLLSHEFQSQGYSTHFVGKWHLGMMTRDYIPTQRGFDSFVGFLGGTLDYFSYEGSDSNFDAIDLRYNEDPMVVPSNNTYSLNFFSEQLNLLVNQLASSSSDNYDIFDNSHSTGVANSQEKSGISSFLQSDVSDQPFFLWVGWQGSHSPSESLGSDLEEYTHGLSEEDILSHAARYNFQAQTTRSDKLLAGFVTQLKQLDLWDNTLLYFASDNGAEAGYGDNSPLRGGKKTFWEGGLRTPAFISGGYLADSLKGTVFDSYPVHVTDWYQTILAAAGLNVTQKRENELDGMNVWDLLQTAGKSDDLEETEEFAQLTTDRVILLNVNNDSCDNEICGAIMLGGKWKLLLSSQDLSVFCYWERTFQVSDDDALGCGGIPDDINSTSCPCQDSVCLFDLENDPCEYYDVSAEYPELTQELYDIMKEYYLEQATPLTAQIGKVENVSVCDPTGNTFGGTASYWEPWANVSNWTSLQFEKYLDELYLHRAVLDAQDVEDGMYQINNGVDGKQKKLHRSLSFLGGLDVSKPWDKVLQIGGILVLFVVFCCCATLMQKAFKNRGIKGKLEVTAASEKIPLRSARGIEIGHYNYRSVV